MIHWSMSGGGNTFQGALLCENVQSTESLFHSILPSPTISFPACIPICIFFKDPKYTGWVLKVRIALE